MENVCVILKEGDNYNFLHRSFQEYFAACFVIGRGREDLTDIVECLGTSLFDTSVMDFIAEMNKEALDRTYLRKLLPKILSDLRDATSDADGFALFYSEFSVRPDGIVTHTFVGDDSLPKYAIHLHIVEKIYGRCGDYEGVHEAIRSGVVSVDPSLMKVKKQVVFGPDLVEGNFHRILSGSKFKLKMIQYLEDLLQCVTEVQVRRDALAERRALARRAI